VLAALAVLVFATEGRFFYDFLPPLLLAEHLYAVDESMATVPLVLMAQDRLQVVPVADVQIAGYSLTQPLVTLQAPDVSLAALNIHRNVIYKYVCREMRTKFWLGNLNERDHLKDVGIDERIILKLVIKK
jgi:hypothetical protein